MEVRELAMDFWRLLNKFQARAEFLQCVELDYIDGESRADNLLLRLAERMTDEYMDELLRDSEMIEIKYQAQAALSPS